MATELDSALLGQRFRDALVYAADLHENQRRKGTEIPYVAHLMSVAALVLEDGGDEDEAIAALLHDAVEDREGDIMQPRQENDKCSCPGHRAWKWGRSLEPAVEKSIHIAAKRFWINL